MPTSPVVSPRADDMECGHPRELLDAYLDAELDTAGSLDVERHLGECSACSAILTRHRALREALRAPEFSHRAPAELRARLENKQGARRSRFAAWSRTGSSRMTGTSNRDTASCLILILNRWRSGAMVSP